MVVVKLIIRILLLPVRISLTIDTSLICKVVLLLIVIK